MKMSKHTPGPWKAYDEFIYGDNSKTIAELRTYQSGEMPWQANARLIAAAPELLEMVRKLMPYCENSSLYDLPDFREAKDLIAKIEGDE